MRFIHSLTAGILLIALGLLGRASAEQSKPRAPGKMVDIGGYKLYLDCRGTRSPTVILDYGLGDVSASWGLVQPEVARFTRVCSYDRAYDGFSDAGPVPQTLHQLVLELHLLLADEHITPPFVLAGNSMGGLLDQVYRSVYPDEVAGIVLVDSTHVDTVMGDKPLRSQAKGVPIPPPQTTIGPLPPYTPEEQKMLDGALARLAKEASDPLQPPFDKLPPEAQPTWRWEHSHPKLPPGGFGPQTNWWAEEMEQLSQERKGKDHVYGEMPLIVLAADSAATDPERLRQVNDLVRMSTDSLLIIDPQSGHRMQLDVPWLVTQSIRVMVDALRAHTRLDAVGLQSVP